MMEERICGMCRFWEQMDRKNRDDELEGRCKRYAPRPATISEGTRILLFSYASWPITKEVGNINGKINCVSGFKGLLSGRKEFGCREWRGYIVV